MEDFRVLLENMASTFDLSKVSKDFRADIQFLVSGDEPGNYFFHVEDGKCILHDGIAESPKITIKTPSEVWRAISTGELNVQKAFFGKKFTVEGNLMLMLSLANLFRSK